MQIGGLGIVWMIMISFGCIVIHYQLVPIAALVLSAIPLMLSVCLMIQTNQHIRFNRHPNDVLYTTHAGQPVNLTIYGVETPYVCAADYCQIYKVADCLTFRPCEEFRSGSMLDTCVVESDTLDDNYIDGADGPYCTTMAFRHEVFGEIFPQVWFAGWSIMLVGGSVVDIGNYYGIWKIQDRCPLPGS